MARINPLASTRPVRRVLSRQFTDPLHPNEPADFHLHALDPVEATAAIGLADEKIKFFIEGDKSKETPPHDFPAVGGEAVTLNKQMCYAIAYITSMQSDVTEAGLPVTDDKYTFEEMVALSLTHQTMYAKLLAMQGELDDVQGEALKNASGARTVLVSVSPSNTTDPTQS